MVRVSFLTLIRRMIECLSMPFRRPRDEQQTGWDVGKSAVVLADDICYAQRHGHVLNIDSW
jgi:hypothetical protein